MSPSVKSVASIAQALGVSLSYFFPPPPRDGLVVRSYERVPFRLADEAVVYVKAAGEFPGRCLEPLIVTYAPGYRSEETSHPGEEFVYVLSGPVVFTINGECYSLNAHDTIHYSSTQPHSVENRSDVPVQLAFVTIPRFLE